MEFLSFLVSVYHSMKRAVANNHDVKRLVDKHPLFLGFIKGRLDKSRFSGLPITFLALSFVFILFLFIGVTKDVIDVDAVIVADERIANLLAVFRSAGLVKVFLWVTLLGKWQVVASFTLAAMGALWLWRKRIYIAPFLFIIIGSEAFKELAKIIFRRPRPETAIYAGHSFSFPSGHATIAVAFYGFLAYICLRQAKQWKTKVGVFFVGAFLILLIGFSRLYLGFHYLSDVWGGYLFGALWLIIGIAISEWLYSRQRK